MPPIAAAPVIAGAALSIAVTLVGLPFIGALGGGFLAASLSKIAPIYQGALVGVATVIWMALLPAAGPDEFALILLWDAGLLACAALGAFAASRLRPAARRS